MGCICSKQSNVHDFVPEVEKIRDHPKYNSTAIYKERPKSGPHRHSATISSTDGRQQAMCRVGGIPHSAKAEQVAAGWPSWLASVAGEAVHGWTPRSPRSYQKLNRIGQGTYSTVYRGRDLTTNKIVAMKLVRFSNMDPDSVRFMAREICMLRRLDHVNVMKLEALVISRISGSVYLVFEYMEHDLAGLVASLEVKFTEAQIKCYVRQMLLGLQHCHSRGILHRDIKGSNLLVGDDGVLKIGDFGLATSFGPDRKQALTSHVVTLWYRAPELLLGATEYGVEIDMWSVGCIIAELFAGKPIMPGSTEVEQMHKIFKLCGSPSEEYWGKSNLPQATSFRPRRPYRRRVAEAFKHFPSSALALVETLLSIDPALRGTASSALKSTFFTSRPLPCDPSSLPKYPPCKELDAKLREEEARRQNAEIVIDDGAEHQRAALEKTCSHDPNTSSQNEKDDAHHSIARQASQLRAKGVSNNDSMDYIAKKKRIFRSGPLIPQGGNADELLKEHERQLQEALRKSHQGKRRDKAGQGEMNMPKY
ncbi:probable serine/threonine-protein kinase At1g09600 [Salvia hispanica]|uniref:probable serine/threonine-protein kinase At1g09600 n=1 Tax=Salvia hispanica TaxID=49212 RepID=UPI0020097669|nr:probable serine/threonine-protein kinase At1g09600 [Salvia hispanica]